MNVRLEATQPGRLDESVRRSEELHAVLWAHATAVAEKQPNSVVVGLFIWSLNEVIDLHAKRLTLGPRTRLPGTIWATLYFVAVLGMSVIGYHAGLAGAGRSMAILALVLAFSAVLTLIADIDRPQEGLLRTTPLPLLDLQRNLGAPGGKSAFVPPFVAPGPFARGQGAFPRRVILQDRSSPPSPIAVANPSRVQRRYPGDHWEGATKSASSVRRHRRRRCSHGPQESSIMKALATALGALALFATLGLPAAQDRPAREPDPAPSGGQAAVSPEREPDVRAITDLLTSFVKAYNAKDAKAIVDLFTPDAEIEDEDGEITRGSDAIVAHFSETFQENGGNTLTVDTESLRFLGTDVAIEEGVASLSTGADTPPLTNRYSVIYARQGGRWLHARIRDEPEEDASPTTDSVNSNGCSASGSTRATTRWSSRPANGRTTATSCSVTST